MTTIRIVIPGEPYSQKRARATIRGKHAGVYDPKSNRNWKAYAQAKMLEAMGERAPVTGPVMLFITAYFKLAKTHHRKRKPVEAAPSQNAKDFDNIAKAVCDAANGVLWVDDRQVWRGTVEKWTGAQGQPPAVIVLMTCGAAALQEER